MAVVTVLIFHPTTSEGEPELVRNLAAVRSELVQRQARLFGDAGARNVVVESEWHDGLTFGEVLAKTAPARGGVIVLSGGAVPLLQRRDADLLVATAASGKRVALTNNRYSSDVCAIADARSLNAMPPLPSDNALPRWLEERAGYTVSELRGRDRLGIDLDTPSDIALAALSPVAPRWLRTAAHDANLELPRLEELRSITGDAHRELLVFGRSSSRTLRWLERNVRCRVRFLAEERGLRASSPLAIGTSTDGIQPRESRPRASLGLLLDQLGASALAEIIDELGDGGIIDSRVLLAHRLGADEAQWPSPADRFASDLLRVSEVEDAWLRELTQSAAGSRSPILLGGHSLVGPGIRLLLG